MITSDNIHRSTEWLWLEVTSGDDLVQPSCSSGATQSQLPRIVPRQLLEISKDGDSTASLGKLCQCLVTLTLKKCFLMFRGNLLCFSLCPLPLVLALGSHQKEPGSVLFSPSFQVFMYIDKIPLTLPFSMLNRSSFTPPHRRDAPAPSWLLWPCAGLSPVSPYLPCTG